jgi:hypothetical protein
VQCCEHLHFHDFVWLLLVASIILLYNHTRIYTEVWKSYANRESVCALKTSDGAGNFVLQAELNQVKVTLPLTVGQSVSLGVEPHLGLMTRYLLLFDSYCIVSVRRPLWREDRSLFCICCCPRQRRLSQIRVPWISRPYFTVSVLRLPFSSPPTTRRVTVEVFDPASTQVWTKLLQESRYIAFAQNTHRKPSCIVASEISRREHVTWLPACTVECDVMRLRGSVFTEP